MHKLYYSPGAASFVLHWLMIELEIPHELQRMDLAAGEHKRPEYLALNPAGVVPTLIVDGQPLCETAALVMHLADNAADRGLAPFTGTIDRGRYYQAIIRCANTLQPAFRRWFFAETMSVESDTQALRERVREQIEAGFALFEEQLAKEGPYLLGDRLSAADFFLVMLMRWSRNMPTPATSFPHLAALATRLKARPSFKTLNEREGLTEWV